MEVNKPSVLIIEDDEILLKALAKGFLRSGFRVATATHPREAVHLSEDQFFDALLVDCLLPSHSGV